MQNKPKLGLDIDGTIRDIYTPLIQMYKLSFPDKWVKPLDEWHWNVGRNFEIGDEIRKYWFGEWVPYCYYTAARLYYPTEEINSLGDRYNLFFVSSSPNEDTEKYTRRWLVSINLDHIPLIVTQYEHKDQANCDVYVDDSPKETRALFNSGKTVYFMIRPWNMWIDDMVVPRINNLKDLP